MKPAKQKPQPPLMAASKIVEILSNSHTKDVFVPECKDGPSWGGQFSRMDVWVMNRSWAHLRFTGYEIKVSRSDFRQDDKWQHYLPLCNELYFVCPKGMLSTDEIPNGVGLKYITGSRVSTVKKAEYREIQPPMELFCYILMCRATIHAPHYFAPPTEESRIEKYRAWARDRKEGKDIGEIVAWHISQKWDSLERQNKALRDSNEHYERVKRLCGELGIRQYESDDQIKEQLARFRDGIPSDFARSLKEASRSIKNVLDRFNQESKEVKNEH